MEFAVAGLPKQSLAYTNCVYVHPDDLARMRGAGPLASAEFDREVEAFGVPMRFGAGHPSRINWSWLLNPSAFHSHW